MGLTIFVSSNRWSREEMIHGFVNVREDTWGIIRYRSFVSFFPEFCRKVAVPDRVRVRGPEPAPVVRAGLRDTPHPGQLRPVLHHRLQRPRADGHVRQLHVVELAADPARPVLQAPLLRRPGQLDRLWRPVRRDGQVSRCSLPVFAG